MSLVRLSLLCLLIVCGWAAAQEVTVPDPGFEQTPPGWSGLDRYPGTVQVDHTIKRSGEASVHITSAEHNMPWLAVSVPVQGGATYVLRTWYRGVAGGKGTVALKVEYYNDNKENTVGRYSDTRTANQTEWQQLELVVPAPADTARAALLVRLMSPGEVWFDDVSLTMTEAPAPVSITTERLPVQAGAPTTVPVEVRFRDALGDTAPQPTLSVTNSAGQVVPGATAALTVAGPHILKGTVTLPALANADHVLKLTFAQGSAQTRIFPYAASRKPGRLSDTGSLLVGGKPFFPILVYHVGPSEYPLLAAHGFNAVQGASGSNVAGHVQALDAARQAGIMSDVPLYLNCKVAANLPLSLQKIAATKDHPAVLDWKIIDEPDLRPDVIDEVADTYRQLKQADPEAPILLTIASPASFPYWIHFCDMLQVDPYPIPRNPLTQVSDTVKAAVAVKQPWQHVTAVLQCGWVSNTDGSPANQPTYDQALCMVYLAVIQGAKGIGWYSMHDPGWDLSKTPLWARFKELNEATARLGEIVLSDEPLAAQVTGEMVQAGAWRHEGRTCLLVTNPDKEARTAVVKLDQPVAACESVTGPVDARVVEGAVQISLPPYASHTLMLR